MDTALPADPTALSRFSTNWLPAPHRMEIWREVFGREVIRLDMAPLDDTPIHYDAAFRAIGPSTIGFGVVSSISCERTRQLLSDGNDDIIMLIPVDGTVSLEQRGAEVVARSGEVLVRRSDDAGKTLSCEGRYMTITLPSRALERRVADIDRLTMTVLPRGTEGLGLLTGYARLLMSEETIAPETRELVGQQLADLAGVALGAQRDQWHVAEQRGMKAARLRAIHAAVRAGAADEGFSINHVAAALRISPGYVRKLLTGEGTSFSALVLDRRLALAHAALCDPALARHPISSIALEVGFGDVSYFNRAFRKRFDATPGEIRATASQP